MPPEIIARAISDDGGDGNERVAGSVAGKAADDPQGGDSLPGGQPGGAARGTVPVAVIDTNVWLDLYMFHDADAQGLARDLAAGAVKAIRSAPTDAELRLVIERPAFAARRAALGPEPLALWEALATLVEAQRSAPWICGDPDDQKFLDLAFSAGATLLFTKDRALLRLARHARRDGLVIRVAKDHQGQPRLTTRPLT